MVQRAFAYTQGQRALARTQGQRLFFGFRVSLLDTNNLEEEAKGRAGGQAEQIAKAAKASREHRSNMARAQQSSSSVRPFCHSLCRTSVTSSLLTCLRGTLTLAAPCLLTWPSLQIVMPMSCYR